MQDINKSRGAGTTTNMFSILIVAISVIAISFITIRIGVMMGLLVSIIPFFVLLVLAIFKNPFVGFVLLFILNYFIIAFIRYFNISGLSVVVDIVIVLIFISVILNAVFVKSSYYKGAKISNGLIFAGIIWFIYCALEILNPTALTNAWFLSRGMSIYLFIMVLVTFLVIKDYRNVSTIVIILSVLTLIGVGKALMQKYYGFDRVEQVFLDAGAYRTHLLLTGTRYFSFYASAGIFGAVMGHAFVFFMILSIYVKNNSKRIYFVFVSLMAFYGLMISGTRGAMAVPLGGFLLFIILSKQIRVMIPTFVIFVISYVFLAFTTIGQGNALIRRMRTVFDPNEPSLMVRKENQKLFAEYLANKPFGEGLGLSGVDAQDISYRFTTTIPTDSWYVKIWVETGIVGLCLHIAILGYIIIYGSYIVYFKIKDRALRGVLTAFICSSFGILVSSYGNQVLGQYPVVLIVYMGMAFVFMGPYFDRQIERRRNEKEQKLAIND